MKVELLYIADCPSRAPAEALLREVLAAEGIESEIEEVLITDEWMARKLRFCGSPTIRIEGRDIDREAEQQRPFGLSCRLYAGSQRLGIPPAAIIREAVRQARGQG